MADDRIYLDWNATAPLRPEARQAVVATLDLLGNASSVHREGRAARALVDEARAAVAALADAAPAHVVFTSGATEAASHVLTPDFRMGRSPLAVSRLYVGASEHPCVLSGGRFARDAVTPLPVVSDGLLDLSALEKALAAHDAAAGLPMVAVQLANNETGVIQPVGEIAALVKARRGILVVDAVQAAGRIPLSISALGADFLILSSHKFGGPKGASALVSAGEIMMPAPLVTGGGQEHGHRSGTENLPSIAGFGAAARAARDEAVGFAAVVGPLRDGMEAAMLAEAPDIVIHGRSAPRLANTSFFSLPGLKAETAQIAFDLEGIAVSAGSACSSGKVGPSHVLKAMGQDGSHGGIRVSLGGTTGEDDVDRFLDAFRTINRRRAARAAACEAAA
ncbi:MAG: cysteine desulfurase family protein [Pararhizobium sp.]